MKIRKPHNNHSRPYKGMTIKVKDNRYEVIKMETTKTLSIDLTVTLRDSDGHEAIFGFDDNKESMSNSSDHCNPDLDYFDMIELSSELIKQIQ